MGGGWGVVVGVFTRPSTSTSLRRHRERGGGNELREYPREGGEQGDRAGPRSAQHLEARTGRGQPHYQQDVRRLPQRHDADPADRRDGDL